MGKGLPPPLPPKVRWEYVADGVRRFRVPGGWIYVLELTGPMGGYRHVEFVKRPPADPLFRLLRLLQDPERLEAFYTGIQRAMTELQARMQGGMPSSLCLGCGEADQPAGAKKCWKCGTELGGGAPPRGGRREPPPPANPGPGPASGGA